MTKKLAIIFTSYNNKDYLDLALDSLKRNTDLTDKEVIVVDDGSTDGTSEMIRLKYPSFVDLIQMNNNVGIPFCLNNAVQICDSEYIMYNDSDQIFPPDWESALFKYVNKNTLVCPNLIESGTSYVCNYFIEKDFGKTHNTFNTKEYEIFEKENRKNEIVSTPLTPYIISKTKFMKVGGYDLNFSPLQMCDIDFYTKLSLDDIIFIKTNETSFYHFGGKGSRNRDDNSISENEFKEREQTNVNKYILKWGFNPGKNYPIGVAKGINFGNNFVRMFGR